MSFWYGKPEREVYEERAFCQRVCNYAMLYNYSIMTENEQMQEYTANLISLEIGTHRNYSIRFYIDLVHTNCITDIMFLNCDTDEVVVYRDISADDFNECSVRFAKRISNQLERGD